MTKSQLESIRKNLFNNTKGWITISKFDLTIGGPGKRYVELGYRLVEEAVTAEGTIWVCLEKL